MKKYILTEISNYITAILFEEDRPVLIHAYNKDEEALLGNIYVGRVRDVVKNINAAFVEIGKDKVCYYSLTDNARPVFLNRKNTDKMCQGDLILVQVCKEAVKSKAPTLSSEISLTGNYVALTLDKKGQAAVSAKIMDENYKKDIHNALVPIVRQGEDAFSLIVRTAAYHVDKQAVIEEAEQLAALAGNIRQKALSRPAFTCLYQSGPLYLADLREAKLSTNDKVITDNETIYENVKNARAELSPKPELYVDNLLPLYKLYNVEKVIKDALSRRVWLKSGAYLVIEPTEALTVIDVNTGKFDETKKNREDTFFKINREAAAEICRQIRLRNISGIIIVDFINMEKNENKEALIDYLRQLLAADPVPAFFVEMTKLGLAELTRKKIKRPLYEIMEKFI